MTGPGSWAERCRVPAAYAAEIPDEVQDTDAAAPDSEGEAFVCTDASVGTFAQLLDMTRTAGLSAGVGRVVSWGEYGSDRVAGHCDRKFVIEDQWLIEL